MGISNLYDVIKKHAPEQLVVYDLAELSSLSVAIDVSVFLYQFKLAGETEFINLFIHFLCRLKRHSIKAVCIFDGPNPPIEKKKEQENRRRTRQIQIETRRSMQTFLKHLKKNLEKYREDGVPEDIQEQARIYLSRKKTGEVMYHDVDHLIQILGSVILKSDRQTAPPTPKNTELAKQIIDIFGLPYMTADGEAEKLCAYLNRIGEVDAVLTEDTDVMAYGTPLMLAFKKLRNDQIYGIHRPSLIESLDLSHEEFLDLCILLKCDYNRHNEYGEENKIKGYPPDGKTHKKPVGIGAVGAWCMIQKYRRLEKVEEHLVDADPLIYRRCRELFSFDTEEFSRTLFAVPANKPVDEIRLATFLKTNKCKITMSYILKQFSPTTMNFRNADSEYASSDDESIEDGEEEGFAFQYE